jgi:alpha-amylase
MLELIRRWEGRFRISYSLTGVILDQLERYAPEVIESYQALAATGCVEFLAETCYHSLSFLYSRKEFGDQVNLHRERIRRLFGAETTVFRNTELIYSNEVGQEAAKLGFRGVLCEGTDALLGYRSPNFLYHPPGLPGITLLLKNYRLSDDIAFRFSNRAWPEWPLTADKFAHWVHQVNSNGYTVNLFMDYETLGEHQWADTGIFDFFRHLPEEILRHPDNDFRTPSEVIERYIPSGEYHVPHVISWADTERDLSAWLGNAMQANSLNEVYRLEKDIKATGDPELLDDWRRLQTSDHFYYMCTKWFSDGDVHKYFNPYDSPYEAFISFMNVLNDIAIRLRDKGVEIKANPAVQPLLVSETPSMLLKTQ